MPSLATAVSLFISIAFAFQPAKKFDVGIEVISSTGAKGESAKVRFDGTNCTIEVGGKKKKGSEKTCTKIKSRLEAISDASLKVHFPVSNHVTAVDLKYDDGKSNWVKRMMLVVPTTCDKNGKCSKDTTPDKSRDLMEAIIEAAQN